MPDKYANMGVMTVTPASANTLTFTELPSYTDIFEKRAFLIARAEYFLSITAMQADMIAEADYIHYGLSTTDDFTTPTLDERSIIDYNNKYIMVQGTPGEHWEVEQPKVKDFSTLPGGGLIVPARPVFAFFQSVGWATAGSMVCKIYFTVKELKPDEYWELVEATRLIS